jgi:multiple sugar transport system substrate-binding protein
MLLAAISAGAMGQGEKDGATQQPVTLQYDFWGDQNEIDATNACLNAYRADNPNIKIEALHFDSATDFNTRIATLQASNMLPDLGYFDGSNVLAWGMNGQLVDLTDFYKSQPAKLDSLKFVTPDGRIVGVCVANDVLVLWYNRKMFDQAGLAYPPARASAAWSWDQFVQVAEELTMDANGLTPGDPGFDPLNTRSFGAWIRDWRMPWIIFAISNGGGLVSQDGRKLLLDDPSTIEAIQNLADLVNVHHVSPAPGTQQMPRQVAMVIGGTGNLQTLGLDFGVGVLPYMKNLSTASTGTPIVVYESSKHLPEALALLKYVMNPQSLLPLLKSGLWLPNESRWYSDPKLVSQWVDNPAHPPEYRTAVVDFALKYSHRLPQYFLPTFSKMDDVVEEALRQVWLGQKTAADVIMNEIMPRIRPIFAGT